MAFFPTTAILLIVVSLSTTFATLSSDFQTQISSPTPSINSRTIGALIDEEESDSHAMEMQLYIAMDKMKTFLEKKLKKKTMNEKCLKTCEQGFQRAENALYDVIDNLKNKDYEFAGMEVGMFASNVHACRESFGNVADAEVQKFEGWTRGVAIDWLEKIDMYTVHKN